MGRAARKKSGRLLKTSAGSPILMSRGRVHSLLLGGLLLVYAATAPPHTVHHGLHHDAGKDCPVLAVSGQATSELPWNPPLEVTLSFVCVLPTARYISYERPASQVYWSRAPPPSLSS